MGFSPHSTEKSAEARSEAVQEIFSALDSRGNIQLYGAVPDTTTYLPRKAPFNTRGFAVNVTVVALGSAGLFGIWLMTLHWIG